MFACGSTADGQRVRLRSQITPNCTVAGGNAAWKFSDIYAEGNIAVQGSYNCRGAYIYDITDADAPILASVYNPPVSQQFLEAIVIGNRGYFGSGAGAGGVHIVDLTNPYSPVLLGTVDSAHGNGFNFIHEMMVFSQDGVTYLLENYNSLGVKALRIINVTNPAAPVFKWEFNPADVTWVHAFHIRGNRMYTSGWGGKIEIYDISNLTTQAPALIGTIQGNSTNHSSWTSEDGNYLFSCRETQDGDLRVYDVRNPALPLLVRSIKTSELGLNAITPHNPVVMGNYLYIAWYQAGIQVFDISDPTFPKRVGQYDTFQSTFAPPAVDGARGQRRRVADAEPWDIICGRENLQNALPSTYDGNWAVYPFLGQNKVLAGDMNSGLIVLDASAIALPSKNRVSDFDGDKRTDLSVFSPGSSRWMIERSSNGATISMRLGAAGDIAAPGDFNGDGKSEVAVFRPSSATWLVRNPQQRSRTYTTVNFGNPGDIPVAADYDADGRTDFAVWRPSNATWYISQSTLGSKTVQFGNVGDKPVTGDWDVDGKTDIGVWRPSDGGWSIRLSSSSITLTGNVGQIGDKPVVADFDGNGATDFAVFRPSDGTWHIVDPLSGIGRTVTWGRDGDIPIPADYDGDGRADFAVFRPSTNQWLYLNSSDGSVTDRIFGRDGDTPSPTSIQPQ
ncbi:MAG: FG-GAP-like repeat-containing protein [Pyrinomonadaceae bacterium]